MRCVEPLERRRLFAVAFFTLSNGTLTLTGTAGDDAITVQRVTSSGLATLRLALNDSSDSILEELVTTVIINAGAGNDSVSCVNDESSVPMALPVIVNGEDGNDEIIATPMDDALYGGAGEDIIYGLAGNDRLFGDDGGDKLLGDDGDDYLSGAAQKDTIEGGLGNDRLNGNGGNDRLFGNGGIDRLYGYDGADWLDGGSSNDRLEGGAGLDTMLGQKGNDHFFAKDGEVDQLFGGDGTDDAAINAGDVIATIESTT